MCGRLHTERIFTRKRCSWFFSFVWASANLNCFRYHMVIASKVMKQFSVKRNAHRDTKKKTTKQTNMNTIVNIRESNWWKVEHFCPDLLVFNILSPTCLKIGLQKILDKVSIFFHAIGAGKKRVLKEKVFTCECLPRSLSVREECCVL